ncbi:MAG: hypothetical protein WEB58_23365 [Planctomycetaceae bacterium]
MSADFSEDDHLTKSRRKQLANELSLDRAKYIFGDARPPVTVWEQQFDYFDEDLQLIARTPLEEIDRDDLWYYHHDLAYVTLQPELFRYLFSLCLWDWHLTLRDNVSCSHGDSEFHYGIVMGKVFETMVTPDELKQVCAFFRDSMLERLNQERQLSNLSLQAICRVLAWIHRFNSLGLINPYMDELWRKWWDVSSPGHAIAAIQYISNLMYFDDENPILTLPGIKIPQTRPYLSGTDSYCHAGWLPENVEFVRKHVTFDYVQTTLENAIERLQSTEDASAAREIIQAFPDRVELVKSRVRELPGHPRRAGMCRRVDGLTNKTSCRCATGMQSCPGHPRPRWSPAFRLLPCLCECSRDEEKDERQQAKSLYSNRLNHRSLSLSIVKIVAASIFSQSISTPRPGPLGA